MYTINSYRNNLIISHFYGDVFTLNTSGGQMSDGNLSYYLCRDFIGTFSLVDDYTVGSTTAIKFGVQKH